VARYRINKTPTSVGIQVTQAGGTQHLLLKAFQECAEGRCSCPTNEYEKVASMQVDGSEDGIEITLEAKPGTDFDVAEIARCLDHTVAPSQRSGQA
jgi:hypothetical protein